MKKQLQDFSNLKILKRNTKLQVNSLYLLSSESSAHSLYFETERDIKFAHRQINRHLKGVMEIVDYLFTPYGWMLVVMVKSESEILTYWKNKRKYSETIRSAIEKKNISMIVSECIRYTISSIARFINYKLRRKGTIVKENFSRYIFQTMEEAKKVMKGMQKYEINLCRQQKRYKAKLGLWKDSMDLLGKDNVFLTTNRMQEAAREGEVGVVRVGVVGLKDYVLRRLIERNITHHFHHISSSNKHKSTQFTPPINRN